ncbi:ankyrin repeat domain-containing protein [Legionella maceachernii]|uniref:Ankyrin repeat protein n=1 Tax=Legionella maceachernii TaxID=466 RepID=A0A0W0VWS0_9GAMM|nr:ankyrin repeat domain-containing protein [Legionella maceachernii]KTD24398.1 ankyrin repeat protein [Legionella maceachernii]SJZ67879.1 hypothetical protein SAMN02745128_00749 [Legionella maceachernii]SUP02090.1 Ankyrin repeats (3 copies) [Legionella maceachernii]
MGTALNLKNSSLIHLAAAHGNIEFFTGLVKGTSGSGFSSFSDVQTWINTAAICGNVEILKYIEIKSPKQISRLLSNTNFSTLTGVCGYGHLDVLQYFAETAPEQFQKKIDEPDSYSPLSWSARFGQLHIFQFLLTKISPEYLDRRMVSSSIIYAFYNGFIEILRVIDKAVPQAFESFTKGIHFDKAAGNAADNGYLAVFEFLNEKMPDYLENNEFSEEHYGLLRRSIEGGHTALIAHFLANPSDFNYADKNKNYEKDVEQFINDTLMQLRERKAKFEDSQSSAKFDVSSKEAKLLFFVLRNLIRRNQLDLDEDISFILLIPAVKNLVHTPVRPGKHNELLRVALKVENKTAAQLLFNSAQKDSKFIRMIFDSNQSMFTQGIKNNTPETTSKGLTGDQDRMDLDSLCP